VTPEELYASPNALAAAYRRFRVSERLLLTGHSHQAWPDRGFEGQQQAWLDAAEHADEKWTRAFERAERVRDGYARLLGDSTGHITLAPNTHDLLIRFLSALPIRARPRLVTTGGEFHTIRRQVDRLAEEGIEVTKVADRPASTVAERLAAAADERTAAVLVSSVFFRDARIVPHLGAVASACELVGAALLVDVYHSLDVVPFSLAAEGLESAFVVGGGYKYCQLGEGNCFLRTPPDCRLRPVITGWFAEFRTLADSRSAEADSLEAERLQTVPYAAGPDRFAGSTYDPTSHYRAAEVFAFFDQHGLTPAFLRTVNQHQVAVLAAKFDALDLDPRVIDRDRSVSLAEIGGFLALRTFRAADLHAGLRERGVRTDYREDLLRFGPAPYLTDSQLEAAMDALGESVRSLV
jgi:kynureninase